MSELPDGWIRAPLGELAKVQLGRQRSPKNHQGAHMRPYMRAANVTWNGLDLSDVKEMNFDPKEAPRFELRPGDLLLAEASGSASEVGKPVLWRGEVPGACFQNTLIRVQTCGPLPEFLLYYFKFLAQCGIFAKGSRGVGIHHLGKQAMEQFEVPVPPVEEQQRIVVAIEEYFSRIDAATGSLVLGRAKASLITDSVMASLMREGWPSIPLEQATNAIYDCAHRTPTYSSDGPYPTLRPRDVVGGVLDLEDAARVDEVEYLIQVARYAPLPGDVVYSRELSFGWAAVVPDESTICLSQGMVCIVPDPTKIDGELLAMQLNSPFVRAQVQRTATGSAHPHVNLRDIRSISVLMPPPGLQEVAREKLSDAARLEQRIARDIDRVQLMSEALKRSVLAHAFSGLLVPQDPDDDPAASLPGRIQIERRTSLVGKSIKKKVRV